MTALERIAEKADSKTLLACKIIIIARDYWRFAYGKIEENKKSKNTRD